MTPLVHTPSRPYPTPRWALQGFTLVEVMVAVTIGLIILAAVAQIFATSRATFSLEEDLARLQESGRFSMDFLSQDVRMSGNLGCLRKFSTLGSTIVDPVNNRLNNAADYGWNFVPGQHISGHGYTGSTGTALTDWTPALPGTINGITYFNPDDVLPNTDVIVVRRAREQSFRLIASAPAIGIVTVPVNNVLKDGHIVLITDCNDGDIFQITGGAPDLLSHLLGGGTPGNAANNLSKPYGINSEVMPLVTRIYYVGRGINERPTLFRKEISGNAADDRDGGTTVRPRPLVDDVEIMRVLYGEDTDTPSDNAANIYRAADDPVINWTRVVSIRIGLLVRTPKQSGPDLDTKIYDVLGDTGSTFDDYDPADDRHQRRLFISTIQLRNPI